MFSVLLKLNDFYTIQEMATHNVPSRLLELLPLYEWNNLLHLQVERVICQSTLLPGHSMRKALFTDGELVDVLLRLTTTAVEISPSAKQFRRGYLGHVTRIANSIQKNFEEDSELRGYIDQQKW